MSRLAPPLKPTDPAWFAAAAEVVAAVGTPDFYRALLTAFERLIRNDAAMVVRYSRFAAPDFLLTTGFTYDAAGLYISGYYRFDPFYAFVQEGGTSGVLGLHQVGGPAFAKGEYRRIFQRDAGISDELGMFLGGIGGGIIALFLERTRGRFTAAEIGRARLVFPLLNELHRLHMDRVLATLGESEAEGDRRPMLLTDALGKRLQVNEAWRREESRDPGLARAVRRLPPEARELPLSDDRVLHAEPLGADFALAPGGRLLLLETRGLAPASLHRQNAKAVFGKELTARELSIVELILAGYPTETIARKLGIGRGTVKNHRRRLYYKLDITTERELFLLYIKALTGEATDAETPASGEAPDRADQ